MLSSHTIIELSAREAFDFLHMLINKMTTVQVVMSVGGSPSLSATVEGKLHFAADGTIWVAGGGDRISGHVTFKPSLAILRRPGNDHTYPFGRVQSSSSEEIPYASTAMTFVFADRSQVSVTEMESYC